MTQRYYIARLPGSFYKRSYDESELQQFFDIEMMPGDIFSLTRESDGEESHLTYEDYQAALKQLDRNPI